MEHSVRSINLYPFIYCLLSSNIKFKAGKCLYSSFLQGRRRHVFSFQRDLIFLGFERVEDAMSGSIVGQRTNATLKFLRDDCVLMAIDSKVIDLLVIGEITRENDRAR